ncbi:unnamed protein product [Amoebophrya sp. A25]|nr:unnamed protein product [Amoebophrya sp. A25]|eukprot:GSA25T00001374001.1
MCFRLDHLVLNYCPFPHHAIHAHGRSLSHLSGIIKWRKALRHFHTPKKEKVLKRRFSESAASCALTRSLSSKPHQNPSKADKDRSIKKGRDRSKQKAEVVAEGLSSVGEVQEEGYYGGRDAQAEKDTGGDAVQPEQDPSLDLEEDQNKSSQKNFYSKSSRRSSIRAAAPRLQQGTVPVESHASIDPNTITPSTTISCSSSGLSCFSSCSSGNAFTSANSGCPFSSSSTSTMRATTMSCSTSRDPHLVEAINNNAASSVRRSRLPQRRSSMYAGAAPPASLINGACARITKEIEDFDLVLARVSSSTSAGGGLGICSSGSTKAGVGGHLQIGGSTSSSCIPAPNCSTSSSSTVSGLFLASGGEEQRNKYSSALPNVGSLQIPMMFQPNPRGIVLTPVEEVGGGAAGLELVLSPAKRDSRASSTASCEEAAVTLDTGLDRSAGELDAGLLEDVDLVGTTALDDAPRAEPALLISTRREDSGRRRSTFPCLLEDESKLLVDTNYNSSRTPAADREDDGCSPIASLLLLSTSDEEREVANRGSNQKGVFRSGGDEQAVGGAGSFVFSDDEDEDHDNDDRSCPRTGCPNNVLSSPAPTIHPRTPPSSNIRATSIVVLGGDHRGLERISEEHLLLKSVSRTSSVPLVQEATCSTSCAAAGTTSTTCITSSAGPGGVVGQGEEAVRNHDARPEMDGPTTSCSSSSIEDARHDEDQSHEDGSSRESSERPGSPCDDSVSGEEYLNMIDPKDLYFGGGDHHHRKTYRSRSNSKSSHHNTRISKSHNHAASSRSSKSTSGVGGHGGVAGVGPSSAGGSSKNTNTCSSTTTSFSHQPTPGGLGGYNAGPGSTSRSSMMAGSLLGHHQVGGSSSASGTTPPGSSGTAQASASSNCREQQSASLFLGQGASASVLRAVHKPSGQPVAVKVINAQKSAAQLVNDVNIFLEMADARSPFLVRMLGAYLVNQQQVHIVLEYMDLGSLADVFRDKFRSAPTSIHKQITGAGGPSRGATSTFLSSSFRIPEPILAFLVMQMTEALKTLHLNDILHRDIKLENILVNSLGEVKLTDFGVSRKLGADEDGRLNTFVGTRACMAPERFGIGSWNSQYGKPSDIWSLGICVYELACGTLPQGRYAFAGLDDGLNWLFDGEGPRLPNNVVPKEQMGVVGAKMSKVTTTGYPGKKESTTKGNPEAYPEAEASSERPVAPSTSKDEHSKNSSTEQLLAQIIDADSPQDGQLQMFEKQIDHQVGALSCSNSTVTPSAGTLSSTCFFSDNGGVPSLSGSRAPEHVVEASSSKNASSSSSTTASPRQHHERPVSQQEHSPSSTTPTFSTNYSKMNSKSKLDNHNFHLLYSPELCDFVACCLQLDPRKRKDVFDLGAHPFLAKAFETTQQEVANFLKEFKGR